MTASEDYPSKKYFEELQGWVTKDSGKREEYDSGMVRDTQEGKPRFDLLLPIGVPYRDQFLTRVADLLARGAEKYSERNWEKASGPDEIARFKSAAQRHLMQWVMGETDEDHAAAVVFNLLAHETTKWKMEHVVTAKDFDQGVRDAQAPKTNKLYCWLAHSHSGDQGECAYGPPGIR